MFKFDTKYSAQDDGGGGGGDKIIYAGDENWDAVWTSSVRLNDEGWYVEMKIPYSAIRFPEKRKSGMVNKFFQVYSSYQGVEFLESC